MLLSKKDEDRLWRKYEKEDPLQEIPYWKIIAQAQLDKAEPLMRQDERKKVVGEIEAHFREELEQTKKQYNETLYDPLRTRLDMKVDLLKQVLWHLKNDVKWQELKRGVE